MAGTLHLNLASLPSIWASYPRVVLNRRPPLTASLSPQEISVAVRGVRIDAAAAARYAATCGFDPTAGLPVTYPHVLATQLHLKIFAQRAFALRPMGLIHLSNVIEGPAALEAGRPMDIAVSACNYRRTDAGLAFDMTTNISADGVSLWRETCVFLARWPEPTERTGARPPRPPKAPKDAAVLAEIDAQPPVPAISQGTRIETQFLTPVQMPARVAVKEWTAEGQKKRALCDVRTGRVHMYAWWSEALSSA